MSVRGGIADILNALAHGSMLLCYSKGLHHIQAPGEPYRLFKKAEISFELVDPHLQKAKWRKKKKLFKMAVVRDLEARMREHA